ncbi:META domain-containing protein [Persicitalea jodogahamensis]|uniref:DUF306 domain-containing protein n=1 Tax=Persicitalea jodogahamensis TaxID=402147 RepID=A0A8J3D5M8_9BACT|nr:META domain-containing protein [Persicitalea jodogahamensis]GHB63464.1 hypothetical protein GCM10007390_16620 [Persicitalea jodogahamensis]
MKPYLVAVLLALITIASCGENLKNKSIDHISALTMETDESSDGLIIGKSWRLIEMEGDVIGAPTNQVNEIHFTLKADQNRFTGIVGCDSFSGSYRLKWGKEIRLSRITITRNDCPEMYARKKNLLNVFGLVDNYTIKGDTLTLLFGERAPLAKFKAARSADSTLAGKVGHHF